MHSQGQGGGGRAAAAAVRAGWSATAAAQPINAHRGATLSIDGTAHAAERFAIDFVQLGDNSSLVQGDPTQNESFGYFGDEIYSAAPGKVVALQDDQPEGSPGVLPPGQTVQTAGGNYVVVDIGKGRYAFYAHMQPGSLKVKVGDTVKTGQVLGLLGNTGNTDGAHLHFHIMDGPSPLLSNGLPFVFTQFTGEGVVTDEQALVEVPRSRRSTPSALTGTHTKEMPLNLEVVGFGGVSEVAGRTSRLRRPWRWRSTSTQRHGPFPGTLDPRSIAQYAAATNDTNPPVVAGDAVPATFPVILIFDAQWAANAAVPKSVYRSGRNGVHGEHEVLLHRPLVPGEALETFSEPFAVRNTRAGARVVLHMEQYGADGALAAEHWWTIFFPGCDELADVGPEPPDHTFPEAAREHLVGSVTQHVDARHRHPVRRGVERLVGAPLRPRVRAAGRASTTCSRTGSARWRCARRPRSGMVAGGDPSRVRRVAVRFASPTRLDEDLTVDVYDASDH